MHLLLYLFLSVSPQRPPAVLSLSGQSHVSHRSRRLEAFHLCTRVGAPKDQLTLGDGGWKLEESTA